MINFVRSYLQEMTQTFLKIGNIMLIMSIVCFGCRTGNSGSRGNNPAGQPAAVSSPENGPYEAYSDSILVEKGTYTDGERTGLWTSWYPNGQIKAEGHYVDGVKNGMWVQWYDDGEVMWKGEWDMGKRIITHPGVNDAMLKFLGNQPQGNVMLRDSTYRLQIRIANIPTELLFVEVSSGKLVAGDAPDHFIYYPPKDSSVKIIVGYYPDPDFRDFRNLVTEFRFTIQ